jgi:hypothetical protein
MRNRLIRLSPILVCAIGVWAVAIFMPPLNLCYVVSAVTLAAAAQYGLTRKFPR